MAPVEAKSKMNSRRKFFSQMNNFRVMNRYCDLDIVIGGKTIPCHRLVLASATGYFDNMLSELLPAENNRVEITLDCVDAAIFETILDYIYLESLDISENNVYDLFMASAKLSMEDLEATCVMYMIDYLPNLPVEQILKTCKYAYVTGREELCDAVVNYIAEYFAIFSKREEFLTMPFEVLKVMFGHAKDEPIADSMLDFLVRWKNAGYGSENQIRKLLTNVVTGCITSDYLAELILSEDHTRISRLSIRVVHIEGSKHKMEKFDYGNVDGKWISDVNYSREKTYEKNITLLGSVFTLSCLGSSNDKSNNLCAINEFVVDGLDGRKESLKNPPAKLSSFLLTSVRNTIYLHIKDAVPKNVLETSFSSKLNDLGKSRSVFSYVYDLDEWFAVPKPKLDVVSSRMTTMNNLLYLVSGFELLYLVSGLECSQYVEFGRNHRAQCYDRRMSTWIKLPKASYSHCNGAACSYNGKLYVLGGNRGKDFEVFDPVAGRWEELMASSYDHSSFTLVEYGNSLWALGGDYGSEMVAERYLLTQNIWIKASTESLNVQGGRIVDAVVLPYR